MTWGKKEIGVKYHYISDLEDTTLQLDFRVSTLEENSGGDGNSSINELEVRVESLENTTTDQETRLSHAETNIEGIGSMSQENLIKFKKKL